MTKKTPVDDAAKISQSETKRGKYVFSLGRRKSARAKVRVYFSGKGEVEVNDKKLKEYFPLQRLQKTILQPLVLLGLEKKVDIHIFPSGGGLVAQSEAARLGISRALVKQNESNKTVLKKEGLLTRDSRKKERKKPGLKRARRAPQWQKR